MSKDATMSMQENEFVNIEEWTALERYLALPQPEQLQTLISHIDYAASLFDHETRTLDKFATVEELLDCVKEMNEAALQLVATCERRRNDVYHAYAQGFGLAMAGHAAEFLARLYERSLVEDQIDPLRGHAPQRLLDKGRHVERRSLAPAITLGIIDAMSRTAPDSVASVHRRLEELGVTAGGAAVAAKPEASK